MNERKQRLTLLIFLCPLVYAFLVFFGVNAVFAGDFVPGGTYDKSNIQEIQDLLPKPIQDQVMEHGWILKTGKLEGYGQQKRFLDLGKKNEGLFDLNANGNLVHKKTGQLVNYVEGYPFPTIDPKDPKAGAQVMENVFACRSWHLGGSANNSYLMWVGQGGIERQLTACGIDLYYWHRQRGEMDNPNHYILQSMIPVLAPFDLRGVVQMQWQYNDHRESTCFAYVPMLRRVRRVSAATRSDPFMGSDMCADDSYGFSGKTASMNWKFIEEKTVLCPFVTLDTVVFPVNPDGSFSKVFNNSVKFGYEDKNFKGAAWAPMTLVWVPRDCYLVEAMPKDPYYNYGRTIFYLDKAAMLINFKEIYNRSGEFWKIYFTANKKIVTSQGEERLDEYEYYQMIDTKANHSCPCNIVSEEGIVPVRANMPLEALGPQYFTETNVRQLSK